MSKAFGTDFVIINDVQQILNPKVFGGGPWIHLATIVRGFKEYMCFKHQPTELVYIEEVDPTHPTLLKKIQDQTEFKDLEEFLTLRGILAIAKDKEFKVATKKD